MSLLDLAAKITLDASGYNKGMNEAEGKASSFGSKLKTGLAAGAKVAVAGLAAVSGAIVKIGKDSVEAYANYEQLVGGVETLFGAQGMSIEDYAKSVGKSVGKVKKEYNSLIKAQELVMQNADKAYKTAGLSANEYMETATASAAAMVSSLKGDTVKAARLTDMAVVDMADNANKMGTLMGSIQNAYAGFAKQNYTINFLMSAA